jgi:phospholipase C
LRHDRYCSGDPRLARIRNVVVIYAENHSFDNLYGCFPGANGIANATAEQKLQLDHDGKPLQELTTWAAAAGRSALREDAERPFRIDAPPINMSKDKVVPSPIHAVLPQHRSRSTAAATTCSPRCRRSAAGRWATTTAARRQQLPPVEVGEGIHARRQLLHGRVRRLVLNHQWLICACTPVHRDAPAGMRMRLDANGKLERSRSPVGRMTAVQVYSGGGVQVTPDGYSVNTSQPPYQPSGVPPADGGSLDLADPKGDGMARRRCRRRRRRRSATRCRRRVLLGVVRRRMEPRAAGRPPAGRRQAHAIYVREGDSPMFQPHHQPFNYYARFAPAPTDRAEHLKDGDDLMRDIAQGTLPAVASVQAAGTLHAASVVHRPRERRPAHGRPARQAARESAVERHAGRASPTTRTAATGITCRRRPGRAGAIAGAGHAHPGADHRPTVKRGFIDSTSYDTTSILKFITRASIWSRCRAFARSGRPDQRSPVAERAGAHARIARRHRDRPDRPGWSA